MKKIILIGKPSDSTKAINERLSKSFQVRFASHSEAVIFGMLTAFSPDAAVISLNDTPKEYISVINRFRAEYSSIPVFAAGSEAELHKLGDICTGIDISGGTDAVFSAVSALLYPDGMPAGEIITVMVIDDDASMLRMIKGMLGDCYNIMLAPSGEKGIKLMEKKTPDIVLLDYEMPGLNGAQTLERIRSSERLHSVPVLFLTGSDTPERLGEISAMDVQGCLIKPSDRDEIIAAVSGVLGK